ncbi:MAG: hypothetical protein ACTSYA_12900 [Candidatus Kariarchaeaceae archaeon]
MNSKIESYIFLPDDRDQQASILSDKDIHREVMENLYRLNLPWQEKATILCDAVPDLKYSLPHLQYWLKIGKLTEDEYNIVSKTVLLSTLSV